MPLKPSDPPHFIPRISSDAGIGDLLAGVVHAADGGDDPDLVPRRGPPVGAAVAEEGLACNCTRCSRRCGAGMRLERRIFQIPAQSAADVVYVHVLAGEDVSR